MKICFICKKEIQRYDGKHIYYCARKNNIVGDKKEIRLKHINFNLKSKLSKDFLFELYINQEFSLPDIQEKFEIDFKSIMFLLDYYGIPRRDHSKAKRTTRMVNKTEVTNILRYGVKNVSSNEKIKEKRKKTFIKRYKVDNIRKSEWFKKYYADLMQERYGKGSLPNIFGNMNKWWENVSPKEKEYRINKLHSGFHKWFDSLTDEELEEYARVRTRVLVKASSSQLEYKILDVLDALSIPYIHQFWISRKSYDVRIVDTNLLLEINGDYWHCNPTKYRENDIVKFPDREIKAKQKWEEDKKKVALAQKYNYNVVTVWEQEINESEDLISLILDKINECIE